MRAGVMKKAAKSPNIIAIIAAMKPIIGPLMPRSNKASLLGAMDFCCITAPKVPIPYPRILQASVNYLE
jgi:hypothetical protein